MADLTSLPLPNYILHRIARLGHENPVPIVDSFISAYACPPCGARVESSPVGWHGWAMEYRCEEVQRATAPYRSDPAGIGWDGVGDHMPGGAS